MKLTGIRLKQFKNYDKANLTFGDFLNCIVGLNGMGKTNLLEAIYYLCMCKSNRNIPDYSLIKEGGTFFRIDGQFYQSADKAKSVVAKIQKGKKKVFEKNGNEYDRLSEHVGQFPVVFISPDDHILITGGSEERRRYLDNTLAQIDAQYLQSLLLYNRVLKQRNALLKQMQDGYKVSYSLIDTYNEQLYPVAAYIFQRRVDFNHQLIPVFQSYYRAISSGKEQADCTYESALHQESLQQLLEKSKSKDLALGRTTEGIHRDDLLLTLNGLPARKLASQGQLKSFLLALRLAQYAVLRVEKGTQPLLLLDDIFDKLDERRVEHLIKVLKDDAFGQVFITDAFKNRLAVILNKLKINARYYYVHEGVVSENAADYEKRKE